MPLPYPRRLSGTTLRWYLQWLAGRYFPNEVTAEQQRLLASAGPGDLVIDAGANVGRITFALALRGATVHAFEPNPVAFEALSRTLGGWPGIVLHNAAVSTREGRVRLYFHHRHREEPLAYSTGSSTVAEKVNVSRDDFVDVPAVDLARFVTDLGKPVSLLKMDIEGAEVELVPHLIASGAAERIETMVVETHEAKAPSLADATRAMRERIAAAGLADRIHLDWT